MNKQNLVKITPIWEQVIKSIEPKIINPKIYEECFKTSKAHDFSNNTLFVIVKSFFAKSVLMNDYHEIIQEELKKYFGFDIQLNCILAEEKSVIKVHDGESLVVQPSTNYSDTSLVASYTLENFIVGDFNRDAYTAACAIVEKIGKVYNPLFIYGGTGLGKTHLMMALGNKIVSRYHDKKVKYIESDIFARQVFNSLSKGGNYIEALKDEYNSYDLFLIDDIQYLVNKEKTNEIFFSIFNSLVKNNKQIVITSDKSPDTLNGFEERMISRFNSGLTLKIVKPDNDSLKRIIIQKLGQENVDFIFDDEAINELIKYYNQDLRMLLGMVNRINFHAIQSLNPNDIITANFVKQYVANQNIVIPKSNVVNPKVVISSICKWYGVKEEFVTGKTRMQGIANVRHICMYVLREKYNMGLKEIGSYFSNRDHTTVMSGVEKVKVLIQKDAELKKYIEDVLLK